jgi:hypothetical protein
MTVYILVKIGVNGNYILTIPRVYESRREAIDLKERLEKEFYPFTYEIESAEVYEEETEDHK